MYKYLGVGLSLVLIACGSQQKGVSQHQNKIKQIQGEETSFQPPMMGWASWNNYRVNINEQIIRSQADAMVSTGLKDVGYSYINTDDGFFGGRDENGKLLHHKERFPSGMKSLSEYIHSKGLKAGIYSDAGPNTCASYWDKDTIGSGMGLFGHEYDDLSVFLKKWDYDFIKVDWCGGEWMGLDEESRYTAIGNIIKSIKPSAKYNVCRWEFPGEWVTNVADSWRISGDIDNTFGSILHIIDLNADLWIHSTAGHYNDMDMLQVGRGMTYEEDKAHFSMWSMMHSPLLLGNDLTAMSNETIAIITNEEIIAVNQSPFVYQARRLVDDGDLEVWAKPMISTMSGEIIVGLLNRSKEVATMTVNLETIGIDDSVGYHMRDLWGKEDFASSTEPNRSFTVPSHGIVVLKVKGKSLPYNKFQYKDEE
ncbi:Alpha-galactosidase A [Arenibacter antarcticus]|uniref:Alpha-galactosidase n=1 Tax=Arenibacter antarcticus TaxID=2040469 RepID=A0ABW5VHT6_9FLAO|nr:glycoside hydrolase family 27 protein [Arenibacter sp. H213]MCM4166541.1 alpha-galactosidase [Arenibacter sp. H213]